MKYNAELNIKDYKDFTKQVDKLSAMGFKLPHTVEKLSNGNYKIEVVTELALDTLDRLSSESV